MNSNANSNAAEPSRYFTVRATRAMGRLIRRIGWFIFSRRMVWTMAVFASLLVLFYQYENWNGAREIAAAREKMIKRIGTVDSMALLPAEVPEEENFFAIPVIKSWRVANPKAAGGFGTTIPEGLHPSRELIAQLAEGLNRPSSQLIPCRRRCVTEAGGDTILANLPNYWGFFTFQEALARQLGESAVTGDAATTRNLAGIMLKLSSAFSTEPELVQAMVGRALHEVTLRALNAGLSCASLTESDYTDIQNWLLKVDDLRQMETVFQNAALQSGHMLIILKQASLNHDLERYFGASGERNEDLWLKALRLGPVGWWDTSGAFAIEQHLTLCGNGGAENWRSGGAATRQIGEKVAKASTIRIVGNFGFLNLRRAVGCIVIPNVSNLWRMAAENLVKRRCAILTCALHRHRLLHGSYPATLTELDASLLPGPLPDPARAEAPLNYRLTERGFLLWSVGLDRVDDGGDAEKDWIWRHEI